MLRCRRLKTKAFWTDGLVCFTRAFALPTHGLLCARTVPLRARFLYTPLLPLLHTVFVLAACTCLCIAIYFWARLSLKLFHTCAYFLLSFFSYTLSSLFPTRHTFMHIPPLTHTLPLLLSPFCALGALLTASFRQATCHTTTHTVRLCLLTARATPLPPRPTTSLPRNLDGWFCVFHCRLAGLARSSLSVFRFFIFLSTSHHACRTRGGICLLRFLLVFRALPTFALPCFCARTFFFIPTVSAHAMGSCCRVSFNMYRLPTFSMLIYYNACPIYLFFSIPFTILPCPGSFVWRVCMLARRATVVRRVAAGLPATFFRI